MSMRIAAACILRGAARPNRCVITNTHTRTWERRHTFNPTLPLHLPAAHAHAHAHAHARTHARTLVIWMHTAIALARVLLRLSSHASVGVPFGYLLGVVPELRGESRNSCTWMILFGTIRNGSDGDCVPET
jgi:ABC-type nitrate/sulfonate/bicarbonate transport system permease component